MHEGLGSHEEAPMIVGAEQAREYGSMAVVAAGNFADVTLDGSQQGPDGHEGYHTAKTNEDDD